MNATNTATTAIMIVGLIEAIKAKLPKVSGIITVVIAIVLGGAIGFLGLNGENLISGIMAGVIAIGGHQLASAAGGK